MTAAELYRRLTLQPRFRVMGMRLVPFTVGHARLLDRIELDEVNDGSSVLLAAKLCSMSAKDAERWIDSPGVEWRIRWLAWTHWRVARSPRQVNLAVQVFSEYLDESTRVPNFESVSDSGGMPLGTPFAQHLRAVLLSKLNYHPDTVDSTPYLQAMWDYISFMESEGRIHVPEDVTDDEESELIRQANELLARVTKEGVK